MIHRDRDEHVRDLAADSACFPSPRSIIAPSGPAFRPARSVEDRGVRPARHGDA